MAREERLEEVVAYSHGLESLLAVATAERDHYRAILDGLIACVTPETYEIRMIDLVRAAVVEVSEARLRPLRRKALDAADEVSLTRG